MTTRADRALPRFLAPDLDEAAGEARLPPDESRHLTRVLRLDDGAVVAVFDGRGHEFRARVTHAHEAGTTVALLEPVVPAAESAVPFTLVQALLKGAAMDDVVRDAAMMGAAAIEPVVTSHTAVKPGVAGRRGNVERWRRIAIASAKQSRRATIPDVREPAPLREALAAHTAGLLLTFVEPSTGRRARPMRDLIGTVRPAQAALLVGPEGGWAAAEIDAAVAAGSMLVTLGRLTMRADAVPVAAIATFRMVWEQVED